MISLATCSNSKLCFAFLTYTMNSQPIRHTVGIVPTICPLQPTCPNSLPCLPQPVSVSQSSSISPCVTCSPFTCAPSHIISHPSINAIQFSTIQQNKIMRSVGLFRKSTHRLPNPIPSVPLRPRRQESHESIMPLIQHSPKRLLRHAHSHNSPDGR